MNFDLQPTLEDDLLIIRPMKDVDFQGLYKAASDPLIWEQHQNKDRYTLHNFTAFFKEGIASKGALVILNKDSKQIIGSSRYKIIDEVEGVIEIGWSFLAREFWGGFYNKKFKKLMISNALDAGKKVVFYVNNKNFRSQRALEKLGAKKVRNLTKSWVLPEDKGMTFLIDTVFE